jgi:hypothetical protein
MNIYFAKHGKSIKFDQSKWGMIGGDHEPAGVLLTLAQLNPNINFSCLWQDEFVKVNNTLF